MRKLLFIIVIIVFTACDKVDCNGKFDGNWQMTEWIDIHSGDTIATRYTRQIYYTVKIDLLQMKDYLATNGLMHISDFHVTADTLYIDKVYERPFDSIVSIDSLARYGCDSTSRFHVDAISNSHMTLSNTLYRLQFRKY